MSRREVVVAAADLLPGDRLQPKARPSKAYDVAYHEEWRVLAPPVKLVQTKDVAVRMGIRDRDPGLMIRLAADEQIAVLRSVPETRARASG